MLNLDSTFDKSNNNSKLLDYWVNNKITDCSKVSTEKSRRKKPKVTNTKKNKSKNVKKK